MRRLFKSLEIYLSPHETFLPPQRYCYKLKTFWFIFEKKSRIYNGPCATQLVDTGCNKQNLKIKHCLNSCMKKWPSLNGLLKTILLLVEKEKQNL